MKLRSIQMLRGMAAVGVLLCHAGLLPLGAAGVDLFFVISGFIIGTVIPGRSFGEFLVARVWRVFPLFLICGLPWFAVAAWSGNLQADRIAASVTLWPVYGSHAAWPYLRPAWSLCFEMLFYYAAALAIATGKGRWIVVAFAGCFMGNQLWPGPLIGFLGYPLIFNFLFGLALTKAPPLRAPVGIAALTIGAIVMACAPASEFAAHSLGFSGPVAILRVLWWGVPSAAIVYGALSLESLATWRLPVRIGDASYSLYLVHLAPAVILPPLLGVPVAIGLGLAVHWYVERPLLRFGRTVQIGLQSRSTQVA